MRLLRRLIVFGILLVLAPYLLTPLYATGRPVSTLMIWRWITGATVSRTWVDLKAMAPAMPRSVVGSEDARFCSHHGIDWDSLQSAIEDAQDGEVSGGGSTITQQVTKNLFLWNGRSFIRKGMEIPLAMWIDLILSKQRILELYLNIAEMGPTGQFGAEAGSQYAFGRSVTSISAREAALLATVLPNPVTRSAKTPGPGLRRLAARYMARAQSSELGRCWD